VANGAGTSWVAERFKAPVLKGEPLSAHPILRTAGKAKQETAKFREQTFVTQVAVIKKWATEVDEMEVGAV